MLDSFEGATNGLPIASRIPLLGDLVSQRNDLSQKSELVIFIRPVVVHDPSIDTDLADYRKYLPTDAFFRDTRPPLPELQRELDRVEQGKLPRGRPNPVVPDPLQPSPGGQT
jgi:general secretion pathway protein D